MELTIKDKKYHIRYTIRGLFVFEKITGRPFKGEQLFDDYVLFYSFLLANNPEFDIAFDEFINECDASPCLYDAFRQWFVREISQQKMFLQETQEQSADVKKKS